MTTMTNVRSHEDLEIWTRSIDLAEAVYSLSARFPSAEKVGLTSQIRKAAVSVLANIAEGAARNGTKEFIAFLGIASGSLAEVDAHLVLCHRLGMAPDDQIATARATVTDVRRMLIALKRSLRSRS